MADKGKNPKAGVAPAAAPAAPAPGAAPPPPDKKEEEKPKEKKVEPKDEVGTRKGCRRYRWELKDSNREFWVMGHAEVKILSLGCLIGAMVMFTGTTVHPLLTLVITMEVSALCFFFIIHTFAIQRYLPFILWPITDLLNDLFCCIFLGGTVFFALTSRKTMPMNYIIAVVLIGLAGLFAFIDICLQRKHFKGKKVKKNVLVPPAKEQAKELEGEKPKEEAKPPETEADKAKKAEKPKEAKKPKEAEKPKDKGKGGKK